MVLIKSAIQCKEEEYSLHRYSIEEKLDISYFTECIKNEHKEELSGKFIHQIQFQDIDGDWCLLKTNDHLKDAFNELTNSGKSTLRVQVHTMKNPILSQLNLESPTTSPENESISLKNKRMFDELLCGYSKKSYGEFIASNPGASKHERLNKLQAIMKDRPDGPSNRRTAWF